MRVYLIMAVIAEKQADGRTLLQDLDGLLGGLPAWTAVAGPFSTDGQDDALVATNDWTQNAIVYENANAGVYMYAYLQGHRWDREGSSGYKEVSGIRIGFSNDWDTALDHPAGETDVTGADPFSADVGFGRNASFDDANYTYHSQEKNDDAQMGVWWRNGNHDRISMGNYGTSYYISATDTHISIAAWNTTDSTNARAGHFSWEYVDNKFWNDGIAPYVAHTNSNNGTRAMYYGFRHFEALNAWNGAHQYGGAGFDGSAWGLVNPDANDDTFFFRRPVIYYSHSKRIPSGYVEDIISNDIDEGGAHGDVITYGGTDYRILRQTGAGSTAVLSAGLRYE